MYRENIGLFGDGFGRVDDRNPYIGDTGAGIWRFLKSPAPHDDAHAERQGATCHLLADVAVAENAEGPPEEPSGFRVFLLVPSSRAQVADVVGDAPIQRQYERERQFGNGDRVFSGTIRYVDAAAGRRVDVD